MFGRSFKLFDVWGFSVGVDTSWFVVAILVAWSLAVGLFPFEFPGLSTRTYWTMGIVGALALFGSIVVHELAHAKAAQRFGLQIRGITLFIFGGVAEMTDEPPTPRSEFVVAIAGPLASIALGLLFAVAAAVGSRLDWSISVLGVLQYLAWINFIVVLFNLVPAFPLDGGRVLRSVLWRWKNDLRWATRVTTSIGSGFGVVLIALGVLSFIDGNLIGGLWWFLIGMFLRNAAQMSYRQLVVRQMLEGEPVLRFMHSDPDTVPRSASILQLVEDHVYRYHHKMFPVVENGRLIGCVSTRDIREIPREEWDSRTVGEVMELCSPENTVPPRADAMRTLARMNRTGRSRLLVAENDELKGVVTLKDLTRFISLKLDIEEQEAA
ncbi:MAG TPA: site-2 protease family protein [Phycisphaerae bacterium]|nr:site-2 protease family protein [Phycisphaerae bacterium]